MEGRRSAPARTVGMGRAAVIEGGRDGLVERHGLWSDDDHLAGADVLKRIERNELDVVRLSFADQHGILRGKTLMAGEAAGAMRNGCTMTTTLLAKDTSHRTVYPVFAAGGGFGMEEMTGGGDFVMVPDPSTFRTLPWAQSTGWMLCDIYFPDGTPVPFSTRALCRDAVRRAAEAGYDYVAGLEVEFHLFMLEDPKLAPEHATQPGTPPDVGLLAHGFQYLTEQRADELDPALEILRGNLIELGMPLRSMEVEFGPCQVEATFRPAAGLESADLMVLFRSAVKQIARRNRLHATFMCRPGLPNLFSSGWHLHQSLLERETGTNAFMPENGEALSRTGRRFVAGLLRHARAASVFTTPTINGYKRFRPHSLAPDRAVWSKDNRGAMIRVLAAPDDRGSRIENRVGEPAANPYLYFASQLLSGLDGIANGLEPSAATDTPYDAEGEPLPGSLMEAVDALRDSGLFRETMGDRFVDYIVTIKQAEIARFLSTVTDWEHREYFGIF